MPFNKHKGLALCASSLLSYCLQWYVANIQPAALCVCFFIRGFTVLCSGYKAFGSRQIGWHGSAPPIYCISDFFHWLPASLYSFPPLNYVSSTRCSWGCRSVPQSSSDREFQLFGLRFLVWTDRLQTPHEWLSGNSESCSLLNLCARSSLL